MINVLVRDTRVDQLQADPSAPVGAPGEGSPVLAAATPHLSRRSPIMSCRISYSFSWVMMLSCSKLICNTKGEETVALSAWATVGRAPCCTVHAAQCKAKPCPAPQPLNHRLRVPTRLGQLRGVLQACHAQVHQLLRGDAVLGDGELGAHAWRQRQERGGVVQAV